MHEATKHKEVFLNTGSQKNGRNINTKCTSVHFNSGAKIKVFERKIAWVLPFKTLALNTIIIVLLESSHSRILAALSFQSQAGLGLGRTFCLKNCVCVCFKNSGGILTFQIFGLVWAPMVGRFELWWLSRGFTSTPPSAATGVGFIAISFRSQVSFGRYYETNCNYPGRYPDHPILFLPD